MMKFKCLVVLLVCFIGLHGFSQNQRVDQLRVKLESMSPEIPGLTQKVNVNIKETSLSTFLMAVADVHKMNISTDPALANLTIINNFADVSVTDLLLFLCQQYKLNVDVIGNILVIKPYEEPVAAPVQKVIGVQYQMGENLLSLDLKDDILYDVFKKITNESGKNLVFSPGLESRPLTIFIRNVPFEDALNKLALANNMTLAKTKDNFYLFEPLDDAGTGISASSQANTGNPRPSKPMRSRKSNFFFNVIDRDTKLLEVDFENTPVANIVNDIGSELNIDIFVATPLETAGNATLKASSITFDQLLEKIFQSPTMGNNAMNMGANANQGTPSTDSYAFSKQDNIYIFGLKSQLSLRTVRLIQLSHRSVELLTDSAQERSAGRVNAQPTITAYGSTSGTTPYDVTRPQSNSYSSGSQQTAKLQGGGNLLEIIPAEVTAGLDVKVDTELNGFVVSGPNLNVDNFERFIKYIDKQVPVILIEVMLLEVNKTSKIETGITAGLGTKPTTTTGTTFPSIDLNLGSQTINNIINNFEGFGSLNIGNVVPNFYLSLKASEENGSINIRSTPRLSTLNGHRAYLSIGETTYYVVTNQNYYGSQIPQASEIRNYQPIDAELSLSIRPLVSTNGDITMDIKVVQSSFNGQKIDKNAPPGINSREFTSIIRAKNQDIIVLGGLEEKIKNDSGSGLPLLSRVPIIKWIFGSRKREDSKKKLSVLIKPTVFY